MRTDWHVYFTSSRIVIKWYTFWRTRRLKQSVRMSSSTFGPEFEEMHSNLWFISTMEKRFPSPVFWSFSKTFLSCLHQSWRRHQQFWSRAAFVLALHYIRASVLPKMLACSKSWILRTVGQPILSRIASHDKFLRTFDGSKLYLAGSVWIICGFLSEIELKKWFSSNQKAVNFCRPKRFFYFRGVTTIIHQPCYCTYGSHFCKKNFSYPKISRLAL